MTTPISNNALPPFTPATTGTGNNPAAAAGASASQSEPGGKVGDQVKLTDSALALQEAARPNHGAMVDQQRVEQIRKAIANGTYRANPTHIAKKMIAMEQQMQGAGKA